MQEEGRDIIIVGGGDGTISYAAARALQHEVTLGVLPLGTMNLFARALGMPLDLEQALVGLNDANEGRVDVGFANDEPFFNHFSVGFHPRLIKLRDRMNYAGQLSKILSGGRALLRASQSADVYSMKFEGDFERFALDTLCAVVTVNPIPGAPGQLPFRPGQSFGKLGLYAWPSTESSDIAQIFADLMLGRWSQSEDVVFHETSVVQMDFDTRPHASLDGEVKLMTERVTFEIRPCALRVLLPATANVSENK
jgi:diacylglycerol kinase family enzyme